MIITKASASPDSLFMLNNFQNGIDFSVNIVKLFHFAHMQEELQILVDGAGRFVALVSSLNLSLVGLAGDVLTDRFEGLFEIVEKFGCNV